METTLKAQGGGITASPATTTKASVKMSKVNEVGIGRVKIAPTVLNDGTIISKFNGGTSFSILPKGRLIICNSVDKYGHYIEFIDEKTFEECVKVYNPLQTYREFLRTYTLKLDSSGLLLDLSIVHDRIVYEFAKKQNCIAPNKASVNTALHTFYIEDEVAIAKVKGVNMNHKLTAYSIINGMNLTEKKDMLRLFGEFVDSLSEDMVTGNIISKADADPKKFIAMWNDVNREYKVLIATLLQKRVLRRNGASIYHNDMSLGLNEELAIDFLKAEVNTELLFQLKKEALS